jgi:uncharacterized protein (DUF488 family)
MSFPMSNTLYTFGYEGLDISAFIARLKSTFVDVVIDVRELPLSRKKGFSKNAFRDLLRASGIEYLHVNNLGCPKVIRDTYKENGCWSQYTKSFTTYLASQAESIKELANVARATNACLVCFEADYSTCHRTYVARAAQKLGGLNIAHLEAKTVRPDYPPRALL